MCGKRTMGDDPQRKKQKKMAHHKKNPEQLWLSSKTQKIRLNTNVVKWKLNLAILNCYSKSIAQMLGGEEGEREKE